LVSGWDKNEPNSPAKLIGHFFAYLADWFLEISPKNGGFLMVFRT
jgi:hypothetical protein